MEKSIISWIKDFTLGKSDKKPQGIYLVVILAYTIISWFVAILLYPQPIDAAHFWISDMGDPAKNTVLYPFFNASLIILGLGLIPQYFYVFQHASTPNIIIGKIGLVVCLIGTIAWGLVGIFHNQIQPIHDTIAYTSFGAYAVGIFFMYGLFLARKIKLPKEWPSWIPMLLIFGEMVIFVLLLFAIPILQDWPFSSIAPWEWGGFLTIMLATFGAHLIIPNTPES